MKKVFSFIAAAFFSLSAMAAYQPQFSIAGFYPLEGTGHQAYSMDVAWRFVKTDVANAQNIDFDDSKWEVVSLPHGLEYLPLDASGGVNYQGPAWYRKHFTPDDALKGKKLFLHFEAIMGKSQVWVNGTLLTEHFGGFLPVIVDVTTYLKWGVDNVIAVKADNSNDPLYLPGKSQNNLDFCYFGGIYRDCWLVAHNDMYITDPNYENEVAGGGLFVSYNNLSEKSATVHLKLHLRNDNKANFAGSVDYDLVDASGNKVVSISDHVKVVNGAATYSVKDITVKNPNLWSPESPDVIALQELDSMTQRSNALDVLHELSLKAQMYPVYAPSIDFQGGKYGIGILSMKKPLSCFRMALPGREEKRTFLLVEFKKDYVACVHFSLTAEDQ